MTSKLYWVLAILLISACSTLGVTDNPGVWKANPELVQYLVQKYSRPQEQIEKIILYAHAYGEKHEFPRPKDILAVAMIESSLDPLAKHPVGPSVGLMQLNLKYHEIENPVNIRQNIKVGKAILSQYSSKFGSVKKTLIAYNAGPANVAGICKSRCRTKYTDKFDKARKELDRFETVVS